MNPYGVTVAHRPLAGRVRMYRGVYRHELVPVTWQQSVYAACLAPFDVIEVDDIRVVRPVLAVVQLAAVVDPATLELALDDGLTKRLYTAGYMHRYLGRAGSQGRRGAGTLRELLVIRGDGRLPAQRALERLVLQVLRDYGQPRPLTQYDVTGLSGKRYRFDFAYPELMIAIEGLSYRYHSSLKAWSRDITRFAELTAKGWLILPAVWFDLKTRPGWFAALVEESREVARNR